MRLRERNVTPKVADTAQPALVNAIEQGLRAELGV
ncbi:hypothetical protein GFK27_18135, partial [Salmonella enterica subsp. enterica serovar Enteritidis]|nr:hypothetical protein [Salmonella enterica subsp. enterica serovar Enteritidis]